MPMPDLLMMASYKGLEEDLGGIILQVPLVTQPVKGLNWTEHLLFIFMCCFRPWVCIEKNATLLAMLTLYRTEEIHNLQLNIGSKLGFCWFLAHFHFCRYHCGFSFGGSRGICHKCKADISVWSIVLFDFCYLLSFCIVSLFIMIIFPFLWSV